MKRSLKDLKIAIVCDSLDQYGGAEKVVWAIHETFPDAPIFTSIYDEKRMKAHGLDTENADIRYHKLSNLFGNTFLL